MRPWIKRTVAGMGAALIVASAALVLPVKSALAEEVVDKELAALVTKGGLVAPLSAANPTLKEIYDIAFSANTFAKAARDVAVQVRTTTDYMSLQLKSIGDLVVSESRDIQLPNHASTRTQVERARVAAQKAFDQAEVNKDKLNGVAAAEVISQGKIDTAIARANAAVAQAESNNGKLNTAIAKADAMKTVTDATWTSSGTAATKASEAAQVAGVIRTLMVALQESSDSNFDMVQAQMAMGGQHEESAALALGVIQDKLTDPRCANENIPDTAFVIGGPMPTEGWLCPPRRAEQLESLRQARDMNEELIETRAKIQEAVDRAVEAKAQRDVSRAVSEAMRDKLEQIRQENKTNSDAQVGEAERIAEGLRGIREELQGMREEMNAPPPDTGDPGDGDDGMPADADGVIPGAGNVGDWLEAGRCLAPRAPTEGSLCGYGPSFTLLGFTVKPLSYCGPTTGFGAMRPLIGAVIIIGAIWMAGRWLLSGLGVATPDQGAA